MKLRVEKSFEKDVDRVSDKKLLRKLRTLISTIEDADMIREIPAIKKIEGYKTYYRVKIGDYRLGMEAVSSREVTLLRFLDRKSVV